jgi:hypothetical protein
MTRHRRSVRASLLHTDARRRPFTQEDDEISRDCQMHCRPRALKMRREPDPLEEARGMALTSSELELEAGTVLPERATPFVLSLLHFGSNQSFTLANNQSVAVNRGFISVLNSAGAQSGQTIVTNQG